MSGENNRPEATCLPAGRYEFKDSGLYIGEWLNEKAVGLGLITKDKCQGEYTGLWDAGMEKSGVFLWPNAPGAMYEGEWASNRRNGYGVFTREDWVIMGKFVDDFISLGVKCKENSIGRFEGEFENGFPSFGVETYADNGSYAGEYKNGIREGLGVRTSIPYGEVINFFPEEAALAAELVLQAKREQAMRNNELNRAATRRGSLLSQRSGDAAEFEQADDEGFGTDEDEPYTSRKPNQSATSPGGGLRDLRMSSKFKCGFVLSSQRSELVLRRQNKLVGNTQGAGAGRKSRDAVGRSSRMRARSLTNLFSRTGSRESIHRMKRQGSSNDRSTFVAYKPIQSESVFTLDQDDAIDPETIEVYAGQWDADTRHGYGVCERSDGVTYEGQWFKNQRHGFGQTRFRDGTCEQGRYQYGKLVFLSWSKGTKPHLLLYNYHIMREVAASVKRARVIAEQARLRATEARENLENVHIAVELSKKAAELARDYSLETRELVQEMYPDFEQPGIKYLDDMVRLMRVTRRGNQVFESALEAAQEVIAGVNLAQANKAAASDAADGQDVEGLDNGYRRSSQNLEIKHGSPVSRAGSYRNRRRSRRSRSSRGRADNARFSPNMHNDAQVNQPDPTQINQPLTLIVPQLTKADMSSPRNHPNIPTRERGDGLTYRGERTQSPSGQVNGLSIPVPDTRMTLNSADLDETDFLAPQSTEPGTCGLTRSPSVVTNYVVLPRITDLHPESEIPSVPLAKLLTNTNLMADHFDHYVRPVTSGALATASRVDQMSPSNTSPVAPPPTSPSGSPGPVTSNITDTAARREPNTAQTSGETPPEPSGQPSLTRRRTMPVFMTQRPADVKFRKNLPTPYEQVHGLPLGSKTKQPNGHVESPHHNKTIQSSTDRRPIPRMQIARNQLILGSASAELIAEELEELAASAAATTGEEYDEDDSTIYLIEEGVRKRVHTKILPIPDPSLPPAEDTPDLRHTDPNWARAIVPVSHDATDKQLIPVSISTRMDSNLGCKSSPNTTADGSRPALLQIPKSVPVVSNILLEDMQDELAPLPTSFRESTINLTQPGTRYSVPNITEHLSHTITGGLTPDELAELTEKSRVKQAEELARKQQGEIVIRLYDLLDWCNRNFILIGVVLLNSTLAYFFFLLTHDSTDS